MLILVSSPFCNFGVGVLLLSEKRFMFLCQDTRDIDEKRRDGIVEKIHQSSIDIAKRRGVKLSEFRIVNQDPPAKCDHSIINAMEVAVRRLNLSHKMMISRAYHDSLFMAR